MPARCRSAPTPRAPPSRPAMAAAAASIAAPVGPCFFLALNPVRRMHMHTNERTGDRMLTGLFRDRDSAERAYQSISDRGYTRDDVNVVMSDETRQRHFTGNTAGRETELGTKAAEGAGIGGAI